MSASTFASHRYKDPDRRDTLFYGARSTATPRCDNYRDAGTSSYRLLDALPLQSDDVAHATDDFRDDYDFDKSYFSRSSASPWNPRASMAFDSAKGLLNPVGENNCFLNSAVQVEHTRVVNFFE